MVCLLCRRGASVFFKYGLDAERIDRPACLGEVNLEFKCPPPRKERKTVFIEG